MKIRIVKPFDIKVYIDKKTKENDRLLVDYHFFVKGEKFDSWLYCKSMKDFKKVVYFDIYEILKDRYT